MSARQQELEVVCVRAAGAHTGRMNGRLGDTALGLAYGRVRLVDSDPRWPGAFRRLAAELRATLGELAVAVEHIGSTAVPGLAAKPILDVAIGLAPGADPAARAVYAELKRRLAAQLAGDRRALHRRQGSLHRGTPLRAHAHRAPNRGRRSPAAPLVALESPLL
jgi:GrpB protein